MHRAGADGHSLRLGDEARGVVDEIDLGEQDDRLRTALPHHREIALEPACVEVERERLHDERDVDVGREHLLARDAERLLA